MADLARIRQAAADAATAQARIADQLNTIRVDMATERARLDTARVTGDTVTAQAAAQRIAQLAEARKEPTSQIAQLHDRFAGDLVALLGDDIDLEGTVPLVLLPVRIEVRSTADRASLRVRIYPDAIHTESLETGVDETETAAATVYWKAVWPDGDTQTPWPELVRAVGARRAPWVAHALTPVNLAARPGADPVFPTPSPAGSTQAVARTLPDRFYVRLEQDGAAPITAHGIAIPDQLPVGLVDQSALVALQLDGHDLPPLDESLKWLVDYTEAERVGMAVTVRLAVPGQPVRKLTVYGVRAALTPAQGAARLENLLRSHHFTDGAEFLKQGTPTNNTESVRTEWSRYTPAGPPDLTVPAALEATANAAVAAAALGVDLASLTSLPGAGDGEQARAAAFNTALWTTTWGHAIAHLTPAGRANGDKRLDNPSLDELRDHWVDSVRGRGSLPVLRLGRQPYGLLPLVATDASWRPLHGGFVEDRVVPFLDRQVRWMWDDAQTAVPTIMNRPLDTALPEILGTDAVLRALRIRTALAPDPVVTGAVALAVPDLGEHPAQQQTTHALLLLAGVDDKELGDNDLVGKKTRSLALPLAHPSDTEFVANLLAPAPRAMRPASVLQVLLAHASEIEQHNRNTLVAPDHLGLVREAVASAQLDVDRDLIAGALDVVYGAQAFDDPRIDEAAQQMTRAVGRLDARVVADRHPIPALAPPTVAQQIAGSQPAIDRLRSPLGLQLVGEIFHTARWAASFRSALTTIANIESLDERRLLLSETLDCCSHRLDAWLTSAATRRLRELRGDGATGSFLGAYGWLENIELRTPTPAGQVDGVDVVHDDTDGGYIHAPGLPQAATAGVLRSGRLSHRRGDPNSEPLDIDLSSTRVRDALTLLGGMRHGQSLGALLGYRLERRLHERSGPGLELDRFIYVLRTLAPLRSGKLTDPGKPVEESLAASDVVDGLKLMEINWETIAAKLAIGPTDQRYIVPPDFWIGPRPGEAEEVKAAIEELAHTHHAVADVLLAESVHHILAGNPARAAATMDVLGAGEAVPSEPEVVRTPRTGTTITHRVGIVVPGQIPAARPGWQPTAPRALAEPRLEAWAQSALADPTTTRIAADHRETLADAGLCALDVLYDADGDSVDQSTLAARLRRRLGSLDDMRLLAPAWELAGILRALIAAGRAFDVADVARPTRDGDLGRHPDADEIVARATAATNGLRAAATSGTVDALAPFGVRSQVPSPTIDLTDDEQAAALTSMIADARGRVTAAESVLSRAAAADPAAAVQFAIQALTAVFGAGFLAIPVISAAPAGEPDLWAQALGPGGVRARPGADIRPWLARAGVLRAATSAYGESLLVREAQGRRPALRVIQTPASGYGTWAGLPFPDARPPQMPLQSMVAEVVGDPGADLSGAVAGTVLDEWTEVVPRRLERFDPAQPDRPPELLDVTTTGMALNAKAPGARPPQAILLAMSPDGGSWTGDRLVHLLDEARALARMRCVTLDQIPYTGRYLPALYFQDWSLQGEPTIDWTKVRAEFTATATTKFLQVKQ